MKQRILLWIAAMLFLVTTLQAQDLPAGVAVAFKKGSSRELNQYLGERVDLIMQNHSTSVDQPSAEKAMSEFFAGNKVSGFNVNHQGKRDESSFIIGTLTTANGSFRVNCFFKKIQNKYLIHQIRIDKTNE